MEERFRYINNGFEGILFLGNGSKDKVIIVMSGSNGGMSMAKHEAEFYHKNGIPAMSLALFKTKQTSPDLVSVPIEYVENAIRYLKEQGYQIVGLENNIENYKCTNVPPFGDA